MKLYEEGKPDTSIKIDSFAKDKQDFLGKTKIEVYESKEGIAYVDFHSLIVSLTKVYLEKMGGERIEEGKAHTVVELKSSKRLADLDGPGLPLQISNSTLLKQGLENWRQKSESMDLSQASETGES